MKHSNLAITLGDVTLVLSQTSDGDVVSVSERKSEDGGPAFDFPIGKVSEARLAALITQAARDGAV